MRQVKYIAVHCSAGNQRNTAADIVNYHLKSLKWSRPGYHYIVEASGRVVNTQPVELISNGVSGYNSVTVNVCYIGGVDVSKKNLPAIDNRTPEQKKALIELLKELKEKFPSAIIQGHRDFPGVNKQCPSFDAKSEYASL